MRAECSRDGKQNIFLFAINSIPILSSLQTGGMDFGNYIAHHPLLAAFLLHHSVGGVSGEGAGGRRREEGGHCLPLSFWSFLCSGG